MSIKDKEYSFSVDRYNKPAEVSGLPAIGMRLLELITMEPGDDPLHPDMGVGIKSYRYSLKELDQLQKRVEDQIKTYLPMYQSVKVETTITPDKMINLKINLGNNSFIYDSGSSIKPITLTDVNY